MSLILSGSRSGRLEGRSVRAGGSNVMCYCLPVQGR